MKDGINMNHRPTGSRRRLSLGILACSVLAGLNTVPTGFAATVAESKDTPTDVTEHALEKQGASSVKRIVVETLEPESDRAKSKKEVAWLGIGTEESSEALSAQLGLHTGEGLVITYIAPESPAAKAGLQKNDVLVEMDGQQMVHPAQLRKLVQMHKPAETVNLDFFRAGRKQSASVSLGRTSSSTGFFGDERSWNGNLRDLKLHLGPRAEDLEHLNETLRRAGLDKENLKIEIRRSVDEARRAAEEAIRQGSSAASKALQELSRHSIDIDKKASVTVRKSGNHVKTIVKSDDDGTYVIVADPKKRLTAHDKWGKLLFDGQIETPGQQGEVPKDVWQKVKPLVESFQDGSEDEN
jgi:hypothetical protein